MRVQLALEPDHGAEARGHGEPKRELELQGNVGHRTSSVTI
jgi:hypothetical protein